MEKVLSKGTLLRLQQHMYWNDSAQCLPERLARLYARQKAVNE